MAFKRRHVSCQFGCNLFANSVLRTPRQKCGLDELHRNAAENAEERTDARADEDSHPLGHAAG